MPAGLQLQPVINYHDSLYLECAYFVYCVRSLSVGLQSKSEVFPIVRQMSQNCEEVISYVYILESQPPCFVYGDYFNCFALTKRAAVFH